MKTTITIAILILTSFLSFSQIKKPKNMNFIPMGTLVIKNDTITREVSINAFWMSEEITNKEYREFINSLKNNPNDSIGVIDFNKFEKTKNKKEVLKFSSYRDILENVIDTSVWNSDNQYKNYFNDKKFDDYPVVGVTFTNAVLYCCWKTKMENEENKKKNSPYTTIYRLPFEAEWEYVATKSSSEQTREITKAKSGVKNEFGLYHLNDNVSEWTLSSAENGEKIIKGSSWKAIRKPDERIQVKNEFRDNATGFRIVKSYLEKINER